MMRKLTLVLLLSVALFSCQHSPRKNYYLLSAPAAATQGSSDITRVLGVGPISIAEYLTRSQIVRIEDDNRMVVAENDYWGEPLEKGIARVITANLALQDNTRSFIQFPWRSDSRPSHSLRVQVQQLNCANGSANLDATWELVDNTTKAVVQRRHFVRSKASSLEPGAIAQAYSQLLADLVGDMQNALAQLH